MLSFAMVAPEATPRMQRQACPQERRDTCSSESLARRNLAEAPRQHPTRANAGNATKNPTCMNRILLIEDNLDLAALIANALAAAGVAADRFDRIDAASAAMCHVDYTALVLDRGLPDGDGLTLLRSLRAGGSQLPCLVLTARDALHDRIDGLETGADDYLPKPFAMDELVARVRALLRRPASTWRSLEPLHGDLTVRTQACQMVCGDQQIVLAPAELQIVLLLVQATGETVRRSKLEAAAWGLSEAVTPNALDVALHRLRRKLGVIGSTMEIVNVRGQGYALRQTGLDR